MRISSGGGGSHHGFISAGGTVFESFGSSSVSVPARSAGAERNVVAIRESTNDPIDQSGLIHNGERFHGLPGTGDQQYQSAAS